jgi:predicted ferric reductase
MTIQAGRARPRPMPATATTGGSRLRGSDVVAVLAAQAVVIAVLWVAHGGPDQLTEGPAGILTAIGQVTALYGTYLALIQLVLMSRNPWLDETFGMDGLAVAHRWLGFTTVWLLLAHGIASTVGYAMSDGVGPIQEFWTLITTYPYVLMATVSGGLFALVAITSVKAARRKLAYETWYGLHLYAYLAIALGFLHQLFVGADFMHDQLAAIYWILLYVATVSLIVVFRIGQPIRTSLRHRLRVANVVHEGPGVVSLYLTGRELQRLDVRAGQYFLWRFLTPDGWWRSHPYSISAAPNGDWLRITVKDLGDGSRDLTRVPIGTRVMVEGPYGILTDVKRTKPGVLLIAGGIGITPLRALVEALPGRPGDITLLYRARRPQEVIFRDELDVLARRRGIEVHYLLGQRGSPAMPRDPLDARGLVTLVPDILERDVYVCAPASMMRATEAALRTLGVPRRQIHAERFAY